MLSKKIIKIKCEMIDFISLILLEIPLLIFLFNWYNYLIGTVVAVLMLSFHFFRSFSESRKEVLEIDFYLVFWLLIIIGIWVFWSGIGGYFYQSSDHAARNAVFRDLINFQWPVIYEKGRYLNYYFGYWLPPTAIIKVLRIFFSFNSWNIGQCILYTYTVFYIFIICLQIFRRNLVTKRNVIIALFCLVFFSGMDSVGLTIKLILGSKFHLPNEIINWWNSNYNLLNHIEWWATKWQYSSNTTQLFWVFNQALPAWLATLIVLNRRDSKEDFYVGVLLFFLAPFPAFGLFLIIFGKVKGDIKKMINSIISKQNIFSVFLFFLIFLFFSENSRATVTTGETLFSIINFSQLELKHYILLILHLLFEVIIFFPIVIYSKRHRKLGVLSLLYLLLLPFIDFAGSYDFQMRSSIPELFVIMLLAIDKFIEFHEYLKKNKVMILITLIFIAITPVIEFTRGIRYMYLYKKVNKLNDSIVTFNGSTDTNFIGSNFYSTKFYKIFKK